MECCNLGMGFLGVSSVLLQLKQMVHTHALPHLLSHIGHTERLYNPVCVDGEGFEVFCLFSLWSWAGDLLVCFTLLPPPLLDRRS